MQNFFRSYGWFIVPIITLIIFTPWVLNLFFLNGEVKTAANLGNKEWLAFWGSYLGGVATLTAVVLTLLQNQKVIKQNEKILNHQEKRARLAHMPFIDVLILNDKDKELHKTKLQPPNTFITLSPNDTLISSQLPKKYHVPIEQGTEEVKESHVTRLIATEINFIRLQITQKGPSLSSKTQLQLENEDLSPPFTLAPGESVILPVLFDSGWPEGNYKFIFSYEDIEGYKYEQFFSIQHRGAKGYSFTPVSNPELKS